MKVKTIDLDRPNMPHVPEPPVKDVSGTYMYTLSDVQLAMRLAYDAAWGKCKSKRDQENIETAIRKVLDK